jgi:cyclic-di-GMP phosphodiesterase, flagellum assembly factor TipF
MVRLAVAALSAVLLCAAAYFAPWPWLSGFWPGASAVPLFSAIALIVSLVAAAVAFRAMRSAGKLRDDILLLARSIDVALRDAAASTEKETATLSEMSGAVTREIAGLAERIATRDDIAAGAPAANADNVVPHPAARRPRAAPAIAEAAAPAPDRGAIEAAYRKAVTSGEFDIALQPIVSVSRSAASGFEVFASLPVEDGERIELRRLAQALPDVESAVFERILATTALSAGRKRLGASSAAMPLHVAISDAILADARELAPLLDMLQFYPDLAGSIVLSIPGGLFDAAGVHAQALGLLSAKGVRFAGEGWDETANAAASIGVEGLDFLKIPANRLLDREKQRRKLVPASTILESAAANDVTIIAVDVATDEDAVSLIDLGIDLMAGPRFGGPKRLKHDGGSRPGRLALL